MHKRLAVEFTGKVQGVGFRYTVQAIARRYPVVGYVKNLMNGNVEVVAEGEALNLKALLDDIKSSMSRHISHEQVTWLEPQGKFKDFKISS